MSDKKTLKEELREYIKDAIEESELSYISKSLNDIAEDMDTSPSSVWRALEHLDEDRIVKVIKSPNKTKPNKIFYLGDNDELLNFIDRLSENIMMIKRGVKEVRSSVKEKDEIVFKAKDQTRKKDLEIKKLEAEIKRLESKLT